jgi:hypothetical protein
MDPPMKVQLTPSMVNRIDAALYEEMLDTLAEADRRQRIADAFQRYPSEPPTMMLLVDGIGGFDD